MVEVELARMLISDVRGFQMIVLKEKAGPRNFPIFIGPAEAWAINRGLRGDSFPRPLTYDLMGNVITSLGGRLERVVVCDLRHDTYYAKLVIRRNGDLVEVDSRPSDAIALATHVHAPIFVEEHVLEAATGSQEGPSEEDEEPEEPEE